MKDLDGNELNYNITKRWVKHNESNNLLKITKNPKLLKDKKMKNQA